MNMLVCFVFEHEFLSRDSINGPGTGGLVGGVLSNGGDNTLTTTN